MEAILDFTSKVIQSEKVEETETTEQSQDRALVKLWCQRIRQAKNKWEDDFQRMREDMEFAVGYQWKGQQKLASSEYTNNLCMGMVNQKVASLYAKNPTTVVTRRERMDFELWDESIDQLTDMIAQATEMTMMQMPLTPEVEAFMNDYEQGKSRQKLVDKLCKTLELLFKHQTDAHKPDYKEQFKQMVRSTIVTGVGYVRIAFCREGYSKPSSVNYGSQTDDRTNRLKQIASKAEMEGELTDDDSRHSTVRSLLISIGAGNALDDGSGLKERLDFDFPVSTSVIVDPRCRSLKEFIAARWIAHEYVLPLDDINAIFETKVEAGGEGISNTETEQVTKFDTKSDEDPLSKNMGTVWEVFDYATKTVFFICDGWKDYLRAPAATEPHVNGFWNTFALTFNDVVTDLECKTSIFPPSDIQLIKSVQKEWNRSRDSLSEHRVANTPKYITREGTLTADDVERLNNSEAHQVIALRSIPDGVEPSKYISVLQQAAIDPALYSTDHLEKDMQLGAGMQQANLGAAQPNVTATVGTIAEESRLNVSASNVDDLDGLLSRVAQACIEMSLQSFSIETVKRIVGRGAVWPIAPEERADFLNEIEAKVEAASSGRPNKGLEVANGNQILPLILQAGGNPKGVIEELARRLDDNIDVTKFFPLTPTTMGATPGQPTQEAGSTVPPSQGEGEMNPPPSAPYPQPALA